MDACPLCPFKDAALEEANRDASDAWSRVARLKAQNERLLASLKAFETTEGDAQHDDEG